MKVGRLVLQPDRALLVGATILGAVILFFPARQMARLHHEVEADRAHLAALDRENAALRREVARLSDPAEIELIARERLALVEPGERLYIVREVPRPTPAPAPPTPGLWRRLLARLIELARGHR